MKLWFTKRRNCTNWLKRLLSARRIIKKTNNWGSRNLLIFQEEWDKQKKDKNFWNRGDKELMNYRALSWTILWMRKTYICDRSFWRIELLTVCFREKFRLFCSSTLTYSQLFIWSNCEQYIYYYLGHCWASTSYCQIFLIWTDSWDSSTNYLRKWVKGGSTDSQKRGTALNLSKRHQLNSYDDWQSRPRKILYRNRATEIGAFEGNQR